MSNIWILLTTVSDPKYEEEVSGCTASVGLISKTTIYVVSPRANTSSAVNTLTQLRPTQAIHVQSLVSRAERNLYHMTTNLRTKVSKTNTALPCCLLPNSQVKRRVYALPEASLISDVSMAI